MVPGGIVDGDCDSFSISLTKKGAWSSMGKVTFCGRRYTKRINVRSRSAIILTNVMHMRARSVAHAFPAFD
jgi:hypothetical protein